MRLRGIDAAIKLIEKIEAEYASHVSEFARVHRDLYEAMGPSSGGAPIGNCESQNAANYEHGFDL